MLYILGKAVWLLAQPGNLLVLVIALGALLLFTRWRGLGRLFVVLAALLALAIAFLPVGDWLLRPLEERFPPLSDLPPKVDGIIMLGGAVNTVITESRRQPTKCCALWSPPCRNVQRPEVATSTRTVREAVCQNEPSRQSSTQSSNRRSPTTYRLGSYLGP